MNTTSQFQIKPDYYNSIEDCLDSIKNKQQTNTRYRNFNQTHFTAGDEEQFQHYRHDIHNDELSKNICMDKNLFSNHSFEYWKGYNNVEATNVIQTFRYLFNKFKKGIFVKIVNNELKVFLPFSNVNFINEWSDNIKIDPMYKSLQEFIKYTNNMEGRTHVKNSINEFVNTWYGNNCLVRYEYPIKECDTNISCIKDMLEELCRNRDVPDIEFFLNRRDFPLLTKNFTEPYYHMWNTMDKPLVSHKYDKYIPILSMSKTDHFADVLFPTHEDWARVSLTDNKYFPKSTINTDYVFNENWETKKSTAVFRGSSTGYGIDVNTNMRLKLVNMKEIINDDPENPYLDVGITKWNTRPRKFMGSEYLQTIDVENLPFKLSEKLTPEEQSNYKYVIHIDGHVSAFRLSYEMNMNSVLLIVESKWKMWYTDFLEPYVHYIPIKHDLEDLIEKIDWCRKNDDKCKKIAFNSKDFYNTYLLKDGIYDYMQKTLVDLKKKCGEYYYNSIKPLDFQLEREYKYLQSIKRYPRSNRKINNGSTLPEIGRSYDLLRGIHLVVNSMKKFNDYTTFKETIFNNKLGDINMYDFMGFKFAVKKTCDEIKRKEHVHEAFIGTVCTNDLLRYIPNFTYTFGLFEEGGYHNVINEYIEGQTFKEYITSDNFSFQEFIFIFMQICLALQMAQRYHCFVHYDLTPWNIIIQRLNEPVFVDYIIDHKQVVRIKTSVIPIIIDYGKSHVIHENMHHGFVNMFKFCSISDVLSLLITSVYQILTEKHLPKNDFANLLKLSNFMSNTTFCKNTFSNSKDLKLYLYNLKKYSSLISSNKHELNSKTPFDMFNYIKKNIKYNLDIKIVNNYEPLMSNKADSFQVFNFITSKNKEERLISYLDFFNTFKNGDNLLPKNSDVIMTYFIAQNTIEKFNNMANNFIAFLGINDVVCKDYTKIIDETRVYVTVYFKSKINSSTINSLKISKNINNSRCNDFDDDIFLLPNKISSLLKHHSNTCITEYKNIIDDVMLRNNIFKLDDKDYKYCIKNLNHVLSIKNVETKICNGNTNTLREISRGIYTKNIEEYENLNEDIKKTYVDILESL